MRTFELPLKRKLPEKYQADCHYLTAVAAKIFDNSHVQLQAFWQTEALNELRVHLFIAALKLHEAWLAEVLKNNLFNTNLIAISNLLSNKRPIVNAHELPIWQSFFMWVPVISSTFASIANQFK